MNKIQRVAAVVSGQCPDRPPVSFWHHFGPDAVSGPEAVGAHLRHLEAYDLDFLKVMDDNRYPRTFNRSGVLTGPEDLDRLQVLNGDEDTSPGPTRPKSAPTSVPPGSAPLPGVP
jgi:uroporphyrinogen decarboxylase